MNQVVTPRDAIPKGDGGTARSLARPIELLQHKEWPGHPPTQLVSRSALSFLSTGVAFGFNLAPRAYVALHYIGLQLAAAAQMVSYLDRLFGPQVEGQFDFTLLFEHVMLTIVPGGVAVLAIPFYLNTALQQARNVRSGALLWLKLVVGLALVAMHITSLVLWQQASRFRSEIALAAAVMSLVTSICILVILYVAHTYCLQPSTFLSVFLTITALFDITMTRSYFRRDDMDMIGALQISVAVLKFILVAFEEVSKRSLYRTEQLRSSIAIETTAGFWNRSIFGWLNSFMIFGYQNDLTIDNLPNLDEAFDSMKLYDQFIPKWNRVNKTSQFGLLIALLWASPWQAFKVIPPRLIFVGLMFSQPLLLYRIVSALRAGEDDDAAHALIGATALVFIGIAITRVLYEHASYRLLTAVRGTLVVAIYDKMHRLPKEKLDELTAVTLMTTDVPAVEQMLQLQYEIWSSTILVGLGIWSLSRFVGSACFLMLIPGLYSFFASRYLGKFLVITRKAWNEEIESRVAATSNVLAQIKGVKAMGLSNAILEYIQAKRQKEVEIALRDRRARIWTIGSAALSHVLSPVLVLVGALFWTRVDNPLNVAEIFAVLAIVNISSSPFITLLHGAVQWSAGFASLQRIQEYLALEEHADPRTDTEASETGLDADNDEEKSHSGPSRPARMPFAVQFDLVAVTSTVMGPILKEVSLLIPWGSLAMLWGPINSGKSTFLKCIIGETKLDSGTVRVGSKSIAYCSQNSWLQNQTIRSNVIGVLEFVEAWYREVLAGCALDVDILALMNGDQFMTGTGGCNLSGGQKQRLSLARAVYAQADIMVIDDVLSALDPDTAQTVFTNLFGKDGLVRRWNCTVVMTTNQLHLLDDATVLFRLHKGGRIEEQEPELSDGSSESGSAAGEEAPDDGSTASDSTADTEAGATNQSTTQPNEPPSVKPADKDLDLVNARETRKYGDWSLYGYFFTSTKLSWLISSICLIGIATTVGAMPNILIRIWYDRNANSRYYFIGYVVFSAGTVLFNSLSSAQYLCRVVPRSSEELHFRVASTAIFATLEYLSQTDSGVLLNRFSQDMSLTSRELPVAFLQFVFAVFNIFIDIAIIASGSAYVTPIIIFILLILYGLQFFYLPAAITLVAISVDVPAGTSAGAVGLALLSLIGFSENASHLIHTWTALEIGLGAISRIKAFCSDTPLEKDTLDGPELSSDWPSMGRLDFNCVSASYQAKDGNSQKALNNVTFTIRPGDKVGISGRTGSGKSSIFMTILRMVEFTGTVSIDGRNSKTISREHLRSRVTTLTQDGVELRGSLLFNIYPFAGVRPDDDLIRTVLESLGLWNHIQRHGGLDGNIIDMRFSVSQKQMLFLARGILHQRANRTRIVLVDEATSAMDMDANAELQDILDEAFAECTILQIAHREDCFRGANLLVQFDAGQLVSVVRTR
ncbi:hypothetical protein PWT90_03234 [Aphanocladium album]|nr:hypothetical protein PWT90_03234 [Aphanocladium album]